MAGRITNFSFLGGYPRDFYMSYTQFWPIWLQTSEILGIARRRPTKKHRVPGAQLLPRGIWESKDTPSPLTTAETPLRVLAGMAPTLTWGGARPFAPQYCSEKAGCTNCKESNRPRGYALMAHFFLGSFFGPVWRDVSRTFPSRGGSPFFLDETLKYATARLNTGPDVVTTERASCSRLGRLTIGGGYPQISGRDGSLASMWGGT